LSIIKHPVHDGRGHRITPADSDFKQHKRPADFDQAVAAVSGACEDKQADLTCGEKSVTTAAVIERQVRGRERRWRTANIKNLSSGAQVVFFNN
jgi:hypothetical protein